MTNSPGLSNAVALIGMSGRFPGASDICGFWRNLCDGVESISTFSESELRAAGVAPERFRDPNYVARAGVLTGIEQFDAEFFRFTAREAECTDPQQRLLLECAWEALEQAGYAAPGFDGRIGVYVGAGASSYWLNNIVGNAAVEANVGSIQLLIGNSSDYYATRISYKLNLTGPSLTVGTACSTSLVAVHLACQSLLDFHSDIALAGGASIQIPVCEGYLYEPGGIGSPDGRCRPFDVRAEGTITGSGVGVVALRRLEDAIEAGDTIHAILLGSAINNDGSDKVGFTAPSELGQAAVIADALGAANISPESITYVEGHGTGTAIGDPIEVAALTRIFRRKTVRRGFCALGSLKSNVGHLDEAAGVAGLIKTALALRERTLPPSLHFEKPNPRLELEKSPFFIPTSAQPWATNGPRRAAVSSFGIGGTNAHVVLEEAPEPPPPAPGRPASLLLLSARTTGALEAMRRNLALHLETHPDLSLTDVSFTLAVGRRAFPCRSARACRTREEAIAWLREPLPTGAGATELRAKRAIFLFPGQGAQSALMGAELYQAEPVFRETIDACATILRDRCGFDILAALRLPDGGGLDETVSAQPALFATEYALAALFRSWGIQPEAMMGHSLGEYVAAVLAGVFSLGDALALVAARGRLMQATPRGAMIAVAGGLADLTSLLHPGISVAALNGPASTVLSGSPEAVIRIETELAARGISSVRLRTSHAFHSASMDAILEPFGEMLRKTPMHPPKTRFISNVTGEWITAVQATDPGYWLRHLRETVQFDKGIVRLLELPDAVWIELGPGRILGSLVARHPSRSPDLNVLPTLAPAKSQRAEYAALLSTLGELWKQGVAVDWRGFFTSERRRRIPLPTYPFERRRYWIEPPHRSSENQTTLPAAAPAADASVDAWFHVPRWLPAAPVAMGSLAGEAWVLLADNSGLAEAVALRLQERGARVEIVHGSEGFQQWPPGANLIYFSMPEARQNPLSDLLALVQALDASPLERRFIVLTAGTQAVRGGNEVSAPACGTLWGAARTVAKEYPNLRCCCIDLEPRPPVDAAGDVLACLGHAADNLATRGGTVWEQHVERIEFAPTRPARLREGGAYLITGGLGSMGLAFAEYLARAKRAKIALVSRTGLDRARFPLLADAKAIAQFEQAACAAADIQPLSTSDGLRPLLEQYCAGIVRDFVATGFNSPGGWCSIMELAERLAILPKFHRFLEVLLRLLVAQGLAERVAEQVRLLDAPGPDPRQLAARFPQFVPLVELISHCVRHFPEALSGRIPAISVLYPDGTSAWLDAAMERFPSYSLDAVYLRAAADLVSQLVVGRSEPIRILEVGGGGGTLTAMLSGLIAEGKVAYHFTDISPSFLARAKEAARERGLRNVRFGRLDISQPPEVQGFAAKSYDMVVGYNVVHATPDLLETVRNLQILLADGGALALVETINPPAWIDLIWGLTDGWWAFTDRDRRAWSPLVSLETWDAVLAEAGFENVASFPRSVAARREFDAGLIVAKVADRSEREKRLRSRIEAMEAAGGEICVIAADVSRPDEMARAVQTAEARLGPLHGAIHTAGVLGQTLIARETPAGMQTVLAPKVDGALNLVSALSHRSLDFLILCSSMSATAPIPGQFSYSAANSFLDSLALHRAARSPGLTVAIDWGFWQELGMMETAHISEAAKQAVRDEIRQHGWVGKGVDILDRVLRSDGPAQLVVSPSYLAGEFATVMDHPALRECVQQSEQRTLFSGSANAESSWWVREHRVSDMVVMPGAAYLDMAVAAFWHHCGKCATELSDVCFLKPMTFRTAETRAIRLMLDKYADGFEFRIFSEVLPECWELHARGSIRAIVATAPRAQLDLADLGRKIGDSQGADDFRDRVENFPPHWRTLREANFRAGEGLACFELAEDLRQDAAQFALHPALFDTATGFMAYRAEFDAFVPFSFGTVRVFDRLPPACTAYFRILPGGSPSTAIFEGSVTDVAGHEILRIEDYRLRRAHRQSSPRPENVRLELGKPGDLQTLGYQPAARIPPAPDEVEIEVRAAGLNFIEVLYSLGMLPNFTGGRVTLGQECSGVVVRAGAGIAHLQPGDEVIAFGPRCFALYTTLSASAVALKPRPLSFEQAAGLPAAFTTAWYSLIELARLRRGEKILIHAAAGGVGLAAVRIAQSRGAEIFATAGSPVKRKFLAELQVPHVFDSRSLLFADEIRRITDGQGIDVVLNSLSGEFITVSLGLLRRHGRFLELGKRDILRNMPCGLGAFANAITFFAVDIGPDVPGFAEMWGGLTARLQRGELEAIPCRIFPAAEAEAAFEYMAQARQIGKVVLSMADAESLRTLACTRESGQAWEKLVPPLPGASASANGTASPGMRQAPAEKTALVAGHSRPSLATEFRAAATPTQQAIALIWERLLGVAPIGVGDDFFELRGDSLLATQVMSRVQRELGVKLPLSIIFEHPTIHALAEEVDARRVSATPADAPADGYEYGVI
jgi:acyl transferase domain-containing protein/D-arabinose 1-dehydrogenase-like Zn-dependent alcohol dehydrogenase/2-polyprenyl-3-methyl-5-hydroxy-6-metoxy-1,4-benzoquinol methylase